MRDPIASDEVTEGFFATAWDRPKGLHNEAGRIDLSLILPTYNERENLRELFARIDRALAGGCFEVIVVDDDSPDRTWAAAQEFQRHYPWLRVIRRRNARGLASAVIYGFRHCRGDVLGVMDADLQHDAALLPVLLGKMDHADFAIATRRAVGGSDGKWSKLRRLGSLLATAIARWMTKTPFSDPMSGFFLVRRDIFQSIDVDLRPRGYKILIYLYAKAAQCVGKDALRFAEVGYQFAKRAHGRSKLSFTVIIDYFLMLMGLRLGARAGARRPQWSHATF
jgi:dolichol-phosphate mannosyltransferase